MEEGNGKETGGDKKGRGEIGKGEGRTCDREGLR